MNGNYGVLRESASIFMVFTLSSVSAFVSALLLLAVAG
jgi:hypothetical protein